MASPSRLGGSGYPGPRMFAPLLIRQTALLRGARLAACALLASGLGLLGGCSSGGGGGSSSGPATVAVPGTATVLPGVCVSGPGPIAGAACMTLTIESLANADATVELRVADPAPGTPLLGTVLLGTGGVGLEFISDSPEGVALSNELLAAGFRIVDRRWEAGWISSKRSFLKQSARYAVLAYWVRDNLHTSGAFCAVGNSGGAAEVAYSLAAWNGEDLFDVAILASGPPLTRLDYLCESPASPTWAAMCLALVAPGLLACGQPTCEPEPNNPVCPLLPASPTPEELLAASILHPGADLDYPNTVVQVLLGDQDCSSTVPLAILYLNSLASPSALGIVPGTPHLLFSTPAGRDAILQALNTALGVPDAGAGQGSVRVHLTWIEFDTSR